MLWLGSEPVDPAKPKIQRTVYTLTECPITYISDESTDIIEIYGLQERYGGLPEPGLYLDQKAVLMDALAVCKEEYHRVREYLHREESKKAAKQSESEARVAKATGKRPRSKHG